MPGSPPFKVFILDDDADLRAALQFSLELDGFTVETFATGEELVQQAEFPEIGCLVVDYRLPGMNGLDALDQLRRRQIRLPAVLITTQPRRSVRQRAAAIGVPIIEKPLLSNALSEHIRRADPRFFNHP